jgi:predicted LPLAT superfamily acyltransferase
MNHVCSLSKVGPWSILLTIEKLMNQEMVAMFDDPIPLRNGRMHDETHHRTPLRRP